MGMERWRGRGDGQGEMEREGQRERERATILARLLGGTHGGVGLVSSVKFDMVAVDGQDAVSRGAKQNRYSGRRGSTMGEAPLMMIMLPVVCFFGAFFGFGMFRAYRRHGDGFKGFFSYDKSRVPMGWSAECISSSELCLLYRPRGGTLTWCVAMLGNRPLTRD